MLIGKTDIEATALLTFKMVYSAFPNENGIVDKEEMKEVFLVLTRAAEMAKNAIDNLTMLEASDIDKPVWIKLGDKTCQ